MNTSNAISVGILIFILITIIIYVIVMFELFKQRKFIFAPYVPPPPPTNSFYPLGAVSPLTQEQIDQRNAIILASVGIAP